MNLATRQRWLAFVYAATIFISAFLLFQIQPLASKHILPWFGGSPAVWTTCLLFFQSLLFAGYSYAHFSNTWLRPPQQAILHLAVIVLALLFLHIVPGPDWEPRGDYDPVARILIILSVSVGLPYFALSATGPLLQAWFARSFPGQAPYRLYALSNIGSLLALVSYPLLFERVFDVPWQATLWSAGFVAYAILCGYAAWRVAACGRVSPTNESESRRDSATCSRVSPTHECASRKDSATAQKSYPTWPDRILWLLLPAFASLVLLATTNHVTADVAVVPLLWIVPLALYLVTFIIAFDRPQLYRPLPIAIITLAAVYFAALASKKTPGKIDLYECGISGHCLQMAVEFVSSHVAPIEKPADFEVDFVVVLLINFIAMFGICMFCHGELARRRPHPLYLTAYYLLIAAGGALGGIAVSLVAPHVFDTYFEWKAAMFVAAVGAIGVILHALVRRSVAADAVPGTTPGTVLPRLLLLLLLLPMSLALLDLLEYFGSPMEGIRYRERNFFGTLAIRERDAKNPQVHSYVLLNGTTVHGTQYIAPEFRGLPTTYYSTVSGVGRLFHVLRTNPSTTGLNIGAVGLGTGTLAAYALPSDYICFYDINPAVIDMVKSGKWFTYVNDCKSRGAICDIKLGDARLALAREGVVSEAVRYHVLVLDAFSGDAIPTHLLTVEAFEIYLKRLTTEKLDGLNGALAVHVSNRYLDLERVVRAAAERLGLGMVEIDSRRVPEKSINAATWIIVSSNKALLAELTKFGVDPAVNTDPPVLWTDARSSLIEILK